MIGVYRILNKVNKPKDIFSYESKDFELIDYKHHEKIKMIFQFNIKEAFVLFFVLLIYL